MRKIYYVWIVLIFAIIGMLGGIVYTRYAVNSDTDISQTTFEAAVLPSPAEVVAAIPQNLFIPKLNVNAFVEQVGQDAGGKMDVPKEVMNTGWYQLGFKPGESGNAVMAGHLDTVTGAPAVFYNLGQLQIGDQVIVTDINGKNLNFEVVRIQSYPFNQVPLEEVFGPSDKPKLNLITCTGVWNVGSRNYSNRLVVYTELKN